MGRLKNSEVITLIVAELGGGRRRVPTEEIAATAAAQRPDLFAFVQPEYRALGWPDKFAVRSALYTARAAARGALVEGSMHRELARDGWRLTSLGVMFAKQHAAVQMMNGDAQEAPRAGAGTPDRRLVSVRSHALFRRFVDGEDLADTALFELADFVSVSPEMAPVALVRKLRKLSTRAAAAGDMEVAAFAEACIHRYRSLVRSASGVDG